MEVLLGKIKVDIKNLIDSYSIRNLYVIIEDDSDGNKDISINITI